MKKFISTLLFFLLLLNLSSCLVIHVLGIPHTRTGVGFDHCAYTMKILNFCKAMKGNEIYHYGVEGAMVDGAVHVSTVSSKSFDSVYPDSYTWHNKWLMLGSSNDRKKDQRELENDFVEGTRRELSKRIQKDHFIMVTYGVLHKPITDSFPDSIVVEMGIGYPGGGIYAHYRIYESYAWMHNVMGNMKWDNRFTDTVIPAFFDSERFPFSSEHDDYFLYVGRIFERKGVYIAAQVTKYIGARLKIMGAGDCATIIEQGFDNVECIGTKDFEERNKIMSRAKALFYPTIYTEPFGCAAVEAMLTGTPVISTDHGAFTETVSHGVTGFRCRTFQDFVKSARMIGTIDRSECRRWAESRYGLDKAKQRYTKYLEDIIRMRSLPSTLIGLEHMGSLGGWYHIDNNDDDDDKNELWKTLRT